MILVDFRFCAGVKAVSIDATEMESFYMSGRCTCLEHVVLSVLLSLLSMLYREIIPLISTSFEFDGVNEMSAI
jgi:hypothetical protein